MAQTTKTSAIEHLLEKLFESQREEWKETLPAQEFERLRHDFVFHMTDWKDDLERFVELIRHPDCQDEEAAATLLIGFFYHVVPHLNAAARLLLGTIDDPFAESGGKLRPLESRNAPATADES